jgi:hypothetical protein
LQICLVDFNQATQLVEGIDMNRIIGIIDHHALQSKTVTIVWHSQSQLCDGLYKTGCNAFCHSLCSRGLLYRKANEFTSVNVACQDQPIFVEIRPWGSACTIVAHMFIRWGKPFPKDIAGILGSG